MMPSDYQPPARNQSNTVLWIVIGVMAFCGVGAVLVLAAAMFPVMTGARTAAIKTRSLSNVKQTALALIMYSADWHDRMPPANRWMDLTMPYTKNVEIYKSPMVVKDNPSAYGYAFRQELDLKDSKKVKDPARKAMVFDSTLLNKNATSNLETLPRPGRYNGSNTIGFLDGHVKSFKDALLNQKDSTARRILE